MRNIIECREIQVGFKSGFTLLIDELIIPVQAFFHLAGANGSGKSSLLKAVSGLLRLQKGWIRIKGEDISGEENWKQDTGIYLGEHHLPGFLTAREYLTLVCRLKNKSTDLIDEALRLNKLGLNELMGGTKLIRQFSQGMKVRLAILGAIIARPSLLILDEPFAHLDQAAQEELRSLLFDFHQWGATILCTCHERELLEGLVTESATLDKGRILAQ
jgi:ABC-2 type transport system ATP-binding protein